MHNSFSTPLIPPLPHYESLPQTAWRQIRQNKPSLGQNFVSINREDGAKVERLSDERKSTLFSLKLTRQSFDKKCPYAGVKGE